MSWIPQSPMVYLLSPVLLPLSSGSLDCSNPISSHHHHRHHHHHYDKGIDDNSENSDNSDSSDSSDNSDSDSDDDDDDDHHHHHHHLSMGANTHVHVDGIGLLNYQRAVDIARNTEGDLDPVVAAYLEGILSAIWARINSRPDSYVMSQDEFAVFNFYRGRFVNNKLVEEAVTRYWRHTHGASL